CSHTSIVQHRTYVLLPCDPSVRKCNLDAEQCVTPRPWRLMVSVSPCLSPTRTLTGARGARTPVSVLHPPRTGSPVGLLRAFSERLGLCGAGIGLGCRPLPPGRIGGVGGDGGDGARAQDGQKREEPRQELRAHVPEPDGNDQARGAPDAGCLETGSVASGEA